MLGVEEIWEDTAAYFREGRSIKGISRPPGVSRAPEFVYERRTQPRPKRERLTLMRIFGLLAARAATTPFGVMHCAGRRIGRRRLRH